MMTNTGDACMDSVLLKRAAEAIINAEGLLVCAGAGMGVDSGLPDFRGDKGFWVAYPLYEKLKLSFADLANPKWFEIDPTLAWGFYGHRLNLYRKTEPHDGFRILLEWGKRLKRGLYAFTSNVDGHFQKAKFPADRIVEAHGSIHHMQCTKECGIGIFSADTFELNIDNDTFRAHEPLPCCPECGALARPNILMFDDGGWNNSRSKVQGIRQQSWLREMPKGKLVVIECGAGAAIPTVRFHSEQMLLLRIAATLIRINPREGTVPDGQISLSVGALAGLSTISNVLSKCAGNSDSTP
jgi:NAD-dependent SIR2 family protein deacetylase